MREDKDLRVSTLLVGEREAKSTERAAKLR
jgi:hypothetical protein